MVRYGFFNSKKLITGDYNRKYNAEDVNNYFKGAVSRDGIYQFVGNQCRVITAGGMDVAVRDGKGQINYHWFEVTSNEILTIRQAHATLNRWTAVIARYDSANRNIYLMTIDGTESERPSKPQIQKTDTLRDICLAYVYVAAGATEITSADIEDAVENIEVCGFVSTLLAGNNGVKKVPQLPMPSISCQGEIYYLIKESKTAGKTYEKGYYYCEPSITEYDYIDFDWTSDTLSNRPSPSTDYVNVLFYANDRNEWYRCVEVSADIYNWQAVVVNEVEELPEPTEYINDQFYIVGNALYKVEKKESYYKWYMFGTGGGGGVGDFAIIRIEYPEGSEVQVTFDGDTFDCPDTSGVWIFGCDTAGMYEISIKNTSAVQMVEITTQGQIENVWISPQVINYALIYYLGNEFANVAGTDEAKYAISTGGWVGITGSRKIGSSSNGTTYCAGFKTNVNINTAGYDSIFIKRTYGYNYVDSNPRGETSVGFYNGFNIQQANGTRYNMFNSTDILKADSQGNNKALLSTTIGSKNINIAFGVGHTTKYSTSESGCTTTKNSNNLYAKSTSDYETGDGSSYVRMYAVGFYKTDDISGLSAYGNNISTILSNATDLFADASALTWMVLNCTGDFMISALSNTNFINAMNTSPNKTILLANEHWNRFIALLSV